MHRGLGAVTAVLLLAPLAVLAQSVFPSKKEKAVASLLDQQHVSARTRKFLRSRMKSHSQDMRELVNSATLLRYEATQSTAMHIANEARLDRSAAVGNPDGVDLTPAFFSLQDALKKNATELAEAAAKREPKQVSADLARTLDTCISCHALFLPQARAEAADAGT